MAAHNIVQKIRILFYANDQITMKHKHSNGTDLKDNLTRISQIKGVGVHNLSLVCCWLLFQRVESIGKRKKHDIKKRVIQLLNTK